MYIFKYHKCGRKPDVSKVKNINKPNFHLAFTKVQYFSRSPMMLIKKRQFGESFAKHHDAYIKKMSVVTRK